MEIDLASATLKINLRAIYDNWKKLDELSASSVETAVVIKADGYSLGATRIANHLRDAGARSFFVAQAEEGRSIRQSLGDSSRIFVLGGHMLGDAEILAKYHLTPLLNSKQQFILHTQQLHDHPFGLQVNSGMNRLGFDREEFTDVLSHFQSYKPELVMSHLACGEDSSHSMNKFQLNEFKSMTLSLDCPKSLAATSGILLGRDYHFDLTRPGIGLYGCFPFTDGTPAVSIEIPVIQIRTVEKGGVVGYGATWKASEPRRIATISCGYADGAPRILENKASLYWNGIKCPFVGRVSMDLITVDVTHLEEDPESLELIGDNQSVDSLASDALTIGHEVLTNLGNRYRKVYES